MALTAEEKHILSLIEQKIEDGYLRVETIRYLAHSEEQYRVLVREIDRVKTQLIRARCCDAAATLTVVEWFLILDRYDWKCAYCRTNPFQSLGHLVAQRKAGTTAENCVPICHSCRAKISKRTFPRQDR